MSRVHMSGAYLMQPNLLSAHASDRLPQACMVELERPAGQSRLES